MDLPVLPVASLTWIEYDEIWFGSTWQKCLHNMNLDDVGQSPLEFLLEYINK
jgi:hypothetical protein